MADRADLISQAAALIELGERTKSNPLYFYDYASAKHENFHLSRANVRILAGGNRSGKTEANAAEIVAAALGFRPWICRQLGIEPDAKQPWVRPDGLPEAALVYNGANVRLQVPNEILVVSGLPMKKGIGEVLHPKIKKLAGPYIEREWMAHGGVPATVLFKNGSKLQYASDEQDAMAFEGANHSAIFLDEPIKKRHYTAIRRGAIDQFARIVMTYTPLGPNAAWIFKDLYSEKDRHKVEVFNCSIYDNKFLSHEAIEDFVSDPTLGALEKEARLYGRFMFLADRIYTNFNSEVHVIPPFKVPADWMHGMVVDPHAVRPWAIGYFAVSPRGDLFIIKEWPQADFTKIRRDNKAPEDYAYLLRSLDADLPIEMRLMDPNYGPKKMQIHGQFIPSLQAELGRFGIHFDCNIPDDLEYGEGKVRNLLAYDVSQPLSALNRPRLYLFETCPNHIRALEYYGYPTKRGTEDPDEARRDESYKDFADLVRYTAVKLASLNALEFSAEHAADYGDDTNETDDSISCYGEE